MTTIAVTPRLSAGTSGVLSRSRSGSLVTSTRTSGSVGTSVATAATSTTAVPAAAPKTLREGYIMFYDTPTAEWQRVYMTLTEATMTMQSTCSRFGRFVRPATQLKSIARFYCSLDAADAPYRHIPILGAYTDKEELFIFRTPERRAMMDWCLYLREACPSVPWLTVEEMSTMRVHFSPQLYGTLFRPDLAAKGLVRTSAVPQPTTSARVGVVPLPARRSSLSAGCPRRGPVRRQGGPTVASQMAAARHMDVEVDGCAGSVPFSPQPSVTALGDVNPNNCERGTTVSPSATASMTGLCPDAKKAMIAGLMHPQPNTRAVSVTNTTTASPQLNSAAINNENVAPIVSSTAKVVSLCNAVPSNTTAPARPAADVVVVPSALEKQLQGKVKELRTELDSVSGRNIDLEIDNANISARVLELEAEVVTMKDGIAEWRRRYQSLEQQLSCQEEGFKSKLAVERAELVSNMKEEVEAQFASLKERFAEREKQLEERIAELVAKYES